MDEHLAALALIMALAAWSIVADDPKGQENEFTGAVRSGQEIRAD